MEAIQEVERTGKPLQLLAVDIKAAFDTISPDLVKQVMKKQQYPEIYLSAIHNLTSTGEAAVLANTVKESSSKHYQVQVKVIHLQHQGMMWAQTQFSEH